MNKERIMKIQDKQSAQQEAISLAVLE